jgi:four helix bundle protein
MPKSELIDLSLSFAVDVLNLCGAIKGRHALANQLERSATSIGANIQEANYAHGRQDFIAKLQIALKECYETEYWLKLFEKANIIQGDAHTRLRSQCGTVRRLLISSISTAKPKI